LLGSVLLHIVFLALLFIHKPNFPTTPPLIEVTIEPPSVIKGPPQTAPSKQIVSPSEAPNIPPKENTERISERDSAAEVEKIKRGDGGGAPGPRSPPAPPVKEPVKENQTPKQPAPLRKQEPEQKSKSRAQTEEEPKESQARDKAEEKTAQDKTPSKPQHLTNLRLDSSTLEEKFGKGAPNDTSSKSPAAARAGSKSAAQQLSQYQAFSRPPGSGAAFVGSGGLSDYLPNLPDGDITLLNAKANQYAGFVRRVAIQVFTELRSRGWDDLTASEVRRISDFTTVEAVLSRSGKLLSVNVQRGSGSQPFDGVLLEAAQAGARDPNPPPGAVADDGLIHFIFKARSWTSTAANPRSGALRERRWLLLATGLE
jgi:TonB family protein